MYSRKDRYHLDNLLMSIKNFNKERLAVRFWDIGLERNCFPSSDAGRGREKSPFGLERRRVPKELRVTYVQASFLIKYQIKHSDYRKPTPFRQMELDSNSC